MRLLTYFAIPTILASFACKSPEYTSFQQSPPPFEVIVSIKANIDGAQDMAMEFAAALRARLATLVTVVPEGVIPPPDAMRLNIEIDQVTRNNISPAAVGAVTGIAVGTLSASANRRYRGNGIFAVLDGLYWGLVVGSDVAESQRHQSYMLGYVPPKVRGMITLSSLDSSKPIYYNSIPTRTVVNEMRPLGSGDRHDYASINEEVARALAKVVTDKLQYKFNWLGKSEPSWYEPVENLN